MMSPLTLVHNLCCPQWEEARLAEQRRDDTQSIPTNESDPSIALATIEGHVAEIKGLINEVVRSTIERKPEYGLTIHQAEWHIRGLIYHLERLLVLYRVVADELGTRALGMADADIILMHSPEMQYLIFEFYALVNLARITLDELIKYIRPLFRKGVHLPKSINDFLKGQSDCPLSDRLDGESVMRYLIDLRNCIVHYRTFATSDSALAIVDGWDESQSEPLSAELDVFRSVTRVYFRRAGGVRVAVNVLLPDRIFESSDSAKKLALPYSYSTRINLLSESREFVRLCTAAVAISLDLLTTTERATYSWVKHA
jgi:hypothetical protein